MPKVTNISIMGGAPDENGVFVDYYVYGNRGMSNVKIGEVIGGVITFDDEMVSNSTEKELDEIERITRLRVSELEDFREGRERKNLCYFKNYNLCDNFLKYGVIACLLILIALLIKITL